MTRVLTLPPPLPAALPEIDSDQLASVTGQTALRDVPAGEARAQKARTALAKAGTDLDRTKRGVWLAKLRLAGSVGGLHPAIIGVIAGSLLFVPGALLGIFVWEISGIAIFAMMFVAYALVGGPVFFALHDLPGEDDDNRRESRAATLYTRRQQAAAAAAAVRAARDELARAEQLANALRVAAERTRRRRLAQDKTQQLLRISYSALSGAQFESYLADVFRNLGYEVTENGGTGDQGVDLVIKRDGECVAIQAKGYTTSVGNAAVQQVYSGMRVHRCHRSAVVTNSAYTASAKQAAQATGVVLIEGTQLHNVIQGTIRI